VNSILLASAGTTAWDEEGRLQGSRSLPLSDGGRSQMQLLAGQFSDMPLRAVYTGSSRHCLESARIIAQGKRVPVRCLQTLSEVNQGLWEGLRLEELERQYARAYRLWLRDACAVRPPHGETIRQAYERVRHAVASLSRRHHDQLVAIVAPRLLRALIQCCLRGLGPEDVWEVYREDAAWEILQIPDTLIGRA
jgi:probable phosphoglycerate mutase